jgi:hypothetical protein
MVLKTSCWFHNVHPSVGLHVTGPKAPAGFDQTQYIKVHQILLGLLDFGIVWIMLSGTSHEGLHKLLHVSSES